MNATSHSRTEKPVKLNLQVLLIHSVDPKVATDIDHNFHTCCFVFPSVPTFQNMTNFKEKECSLLV